MLLEGWAWSMGTPSSRSLSQCFQNNPLKLHHTKLHKNIMIKEAGNRIHLGKIKDYNSEIQDNPIPHFEMIQKHFEFLKTDFD